MPAAAAPEAAAQHDGTGYRRVADGAHRGAALPLPGDVWAEGDSFEAVEKTLEVVFHPHSLPALWRGGKGLLAVANSDWATLIAHVNAQLLSSVDDAAFDPAGATVAAHVLSESSLFVTNTTVLAKTCGTTLLLELLEPLLAFLNAETGGGVAMVRYTRMNYFFEDKQHGRQGEWRTEAGNLEAMLPKGTFVHADTVGDADNTWFWLESGFFETNGGEEGEVHANDAALEADKVQMHQHESFELIFTQLPYETLTQYCQPYFSAFLNDFLDIVNRPARSTAGKAAIVDDFIFDPCGYSGNGLMGNGSYWTIHLTPEPTSSYVSIETNLLNDETARTFSDLVDLFRPDHVAVQVHRTAPRDAATAAEDNRASEAVRSFMDRHVLKTGWLDGEHFAAPRFEEMHYTQDGWDNALALAIFERK